MIRSGLPKEKIMPVFHQNDKFEWLERYLNYGVEYLGISPANDKSSSSRMMWLNECMKYICDKKGFPKVKIHGFAVTSFLLMKKTVIISRR